MKAELDLNGRGADLAGARAPSVHACGTRTITTRVPADAHEE
jgi:hypothetical protein